MEVGRTSCEERRGGPAASIVGEQRAALGKSWQSGRDLSPDKLYHSHEASSPRAFSQQH